MQIVMLLSIVWSINLNAGVENIFAESAPSRTSGLMLEIATTRQTHFAWEPVTLVCRLRNMADHDSMVFFDPNSLSLVISGKSAVASRRMVDDLPGGRWIVPSGDKVYFIVGLRTLPIGKATISLRYAPPTRDRTRHAAGIAVYGDTLQSNDLTIEVVPSEPRTSAEKGQIKNVVRQYMDESILLGGGERGIGASHALIKMGRYAIPALLEELESPDLKLRSEALFFLGQIGLGEEPNAPEGHRPLDDAFIDALVAAYKKENSVDVKRDYVWVMAGYGNASPEKRTLIIETLKETLNSHSSQSLRANAASALLQFSRIDGLHEVIDNLNRVNSPQFFGDKGRNDVLHILGDIMRSEWERQHPDTPMTMETLAELNLEGHNNPAKSLKVWWQENKERLIAEQAAADAAREKNQTDNGASPKTEPEPKEKPRRR